MTTMETLTEMKRAYEETLKKEGKRILGEAFKKFFSELPIVTAIEWTQYTPYFNDGDPCVFSVGEFRYRFQDSKGDEGDYEDGFLSTWSTDLKSKGIQTEIQNFEKQFAGHDDLFLVLFGDHAKVTATSTGFEIDEYSHE